VVPHVQVDDLEGVLAFHRDGLDWRAVDEMRADGRRLRVRLRNCDAHPMLSDRPAHHRSRLTWLYVDDADAAYREQVARRVEPLSAPAEQPHRNHEFLVEAPEGELSCT